MADPKVLFTELRRLLISASALASPPYVEPGPKPAEDPCRDLLGLSAGLEFHHPAPRVSTRTAPPAEKKGVSNTSS